MKLTVIPIITGALATAPKDFLRGLEELEIGVRVKTIKTTALLK